MPSSISYISLIWQTVKQSFKVPRPLVVCMFFFICLFVCFVCLIVLLFVGLNFQKSGFFVECGALDGDRSSNSLHLETHLKWAGVLIEMDPYFYAQLIGKNRKAYSINACLSPTGQVSIVRFTRRKTDFRSNKMIMIL